MDLNSKLLSRYINILNEFGFDCREERIFLETHKGNNQLMRLCRMSKRIKTAVQDNMLRDRSGSTNFEEV